MVVADAPEPVGGGKEGEEEEDEDGDGNEDEEDPLEEKRAKTAATAKQGELAKKTSGPKSGKKEKTPGKKSSRK